jgi:hypothetical protein
MIQILINFKSKTYVHITNIMDSFVTGPHIYFLPPGTLGIEEI